jgi:protein-L-isoaspartate(D-aspartate) O-methyltransferase
MNRLQAFATILTLSLISALACRAQEPSATRQDGKDRFARARAAMVESQLATRDISNRRVLDAMNRVPRHEFVLSSWVDRAYDDRALPIRHGQTISQPYIVALMTQLANPKEGDRVLDIGTGSGYQAAVLAEMGAKVSSIEIVPGLANEAGERLRRLGYDGIEVRAGDGYRGWPEHAPFAAIVLAAAAPEVPAPLIEQLAPGGRLVIPVGPEGRLQELLLLTQEPDGHISRKSITPVIFVPMTGEARKAARPQDK